MFGIVGVLALIVGAMYIPGMLSGRGQTPTPDAPQPVVQTPATNAASPTAAPQENVPKPIPSPTGQSAPAQTALLAQYRPDPFAPFLVSAPPAVPTPEPVPIPPPVVITPLNPGGTGGSVRIPGGATGQSLPPLNLPSVNIPRANVAKQGPRDAFPPARQTGGGGASGPTASEPQPSYNKRLSGYLISERTGVRALLEISDGGAVTTAVVRPGDEVEGVRVLSIQNTPVGGTSVVRMLVREANGQESYVDLKAAPQTTGEGGIGEAGNR